MTRAFARAARPLIATIAASLVAAGCATVTRSSETPSGTPTRSSSFQPSLSHDGRFVAFTSTSSDLAGADGNETYDVFVRDHQTNSVELISAKFATTRSGSAASDRPSISANGNVVAFRSLAPGLATNVDDTNGAADILVRDRGAGITTQVSISSDSTVANNTSDTPAVSGDGRYVAFASAASNLVPGDTNSSWDIFVRDRYTYTTTLVSVRAAGGFANGSSGFPAVSSDGRFIVFSSTATNLVAGDTNGVADVFVRDLVGGTTARVSLTNGGAQAAGASGAPAISGDGRYVAFDSVAANLVSGDTNAASDVFVRDRTGARTTRASITTGGTQATGPSDGPTVSPDGRWVAFQSRAANLVAGDTNNTLDVFARDQTTNATSRVSTSTLQAQGNGPSGGVPSISGDGRYVAFQSGASNLFDNDTNAEDDIFTRYLTVPKIAALSPTSIARGASVTLTVTGSGFLPGAIVLVPVQGTTVGAVNVLNENQLTVRLSVAANVPPATIPFWVVLLGTGPGAAKSAVDICACLTIT